jgi:hypothetical protein
MSFYRSASLVLLIPLAGCGSDFFAVEVLPPRTSVTCAAPAVGAAALGRGVLDLEASRAREGAYVADLRLASTRDAVVDGLRFAYDLPEDASSGSEDAADDAAIDAVVGDVVLDATDEDELRRAVLQDVVLIPRDLAVALRDDDSLDVDAQTYAQVVVRATPLVKFGAPASEASTFAIDVCRGCLAVKPSEEECPDGVVEADVCRFGQDVASFSCAAPPPGGGA